jgi:hypothetical protein
MSCFHRDASLFPRRRVRTWVIAFISDRYCRFFSAGSRGRGGRYRVICEGGTRRENQGQGERPKPHIPAQLRESVHNNLPRSNQTNPTVPQKLAFVTLEWRVVAHFLEQKDSTVTHITL